MAIWICGLVNIQKGINYVHALMESMRDLSQSCDHLSKILIINDLLYFRSTKFTYFNHLIAKRYYEDRKSYITKGFRLSVHFDFGIE